MTMQTCNFSDNKKFFYDEDAEVIGNKNIELSVITKKILKIKTKRYIITSEHERELNIDYLKINF
jgi:hypothetical protein